MKQGKIYSVGQGMMTQGGGGSMTTKTFTNKKEAVKYFNSIKKDLSGWANKPPHGYLLTDVEIFIGDIEDPFTWEYEDTIERYEARWY